MKLLGFMLATLAAGACADRYCADTSTCGRSGVGESCLLDRDCLDGLECGGQTKSGTCVEVCGDDGTGGDEDCNKKKGAFCDFSAACISNHCVDGFCCESACDGSCRSCKFPGSQGMCVPYPHPPCQSD